MPNYHRLYVPGGSFFFTVVTEGRVPFLCCETARGHLRNVLQACRQLWPFRIDAIVLLPDYLHAIWTLPQGDSDYSKRWGWIKKEFTKAWLAGGGTERTRSESRVRNRRRGVWQRRFWEHTLRDEEDFEKHFDYVHYNPVKHGLVQSPRDWPYSSFHRWVRLSVYPPDWGCSPAGVRHLDKLDKTAMEPE
jgi:putative transposase